MQELQIPYGRGQGRGPISQASDEQLRNFVTYQRRQFDEGNVEERYYESNMQQLEAAEQELERRQAFDDLDPPTGADQPASTRSLATHTTSTLPQIHDAEAVTARLRDFAAKCHMVTPAMQVDALPEGFGVSMAMLAVDVERDTHSVGGGKFGLSGDTLRRIAAAAGVSWDFEGSCRLDDGSDPHYCHFRAVGHVRNFDGTQRQIVGQVEIDARDGSPQLDEIIQKAREAKPPRDPDKQIRELRKFILRHAESKAQNRAIASMGVRRCYEKQELAKPFVIARLTYTGQTEDPGLRRELALMGARAALTSGLYPRG